tara:strand:- start:29 stop:133 length:105 start_codon:yes stop_codon:yes gene_type:complete
MYNERDIDSDNDDMWLRKKEEEEEQQCFEKGDEK